MGGSYKVIVAIVCTCTGIGAPTSRSSDRYNKHVLRTDSTYRRGIGGHLPASASASTERTARPQGKLHMTRLILVGLINVVLFGVCSGAPLVIRNVSYSTSLGSCDDCPSCTCMDIFMPSGNASAPTPPAPFVLFFHGGLWYSGRRGEIDEVCTAIVSLSNGTVGCATADYHYSQDLGGTCRAGGAETFTKQAGEVLAALTTLGAYQGVDQTRIVLAGHSAGGHLAAWLALNWPPSRNLTSFARSAAAPARALPPRPLGFAGVEGIYNASLWDAYQRGARWQGEFDCADRQAFGDPNVDPHSWVAGSPVARAEAEVAPAAPLLLVHSPGDDWVEISQAAQLFAVLRPPMTGQAAKQRLDIQGACAAGEHPQVLQGASAGLLARCMLQFFAD